MLVYWEDLINMGLLIVAIIGLIMSFYDNKNQKK